jgi:protein-arginine kinase
MEKIFFCISMLQLAENCPQCSFQSQIDSTAKIGHLECIKHDLELVYGKKRFFCISMLQLAENCPQCLFHLK